MIQRTFSESLQYDIEVEATRGPRAEGSRTVVAAVVSYRANPADAWPSPMLILGGHGLTREAWRDVVAKVERAFGEFDRLLETLAEPSQAAAAQSATQNVTPTE